MDMNQFGVRSRMFLNITKNLYLAPARAGVKVFVNVSVTSYLAYSCAIEKDIALKQQPVFMEVRLKMTWKNTK